MTTDLTDQIEVEYVIRKGSYYYRPNAQGYTSSINTAGRFSLEEAILHSYPNGPDGPRDGIDYMPAPTRQASVPAQTEPVAWMDLLANAYAQGAEDVHKSWIDGTASNIPDFGEAASDYARSIDFPPTERERALLEALRDAVERFVPPAIYQLEKAAISAMPDSYTQGWNAAIEAAAKVADKRADERFSEYGTTEPDTNASYYSGRHAESLDELDEEDWAIAKAITALKKPTS